MTIRRRELSACEVLLELGVVGLINSAALITFSMIGFGILKIPAVLSGNAAPAENLTKELPLFSLASAINMLPLYAGIIYLRRTNANHDFSTSLKILFCLYAAISTASITMVSAIFRDQKNTGFWPVLHFAAGNCLLLPLLYLIVMHLKTIRDVTLRTGRLELLGVSVDVVMPEMPEMPEMPPPPHVIIMGTLPGAPITGSPVEGMVTSAGSMPREISEDRMAFPVGAAPTP